MSRPYGRRPPYRRRIGFACTAWLVVLGALLAAAVLVFTPKAHAAPVNADQQAFQYWAHHGSTVCSTLDKDPTVDGLTTAALDIFTHTSLNVNQAGQVIALAIHFTCPQHHNLIDQYIARGELA